MLLGGALYSAGLAAQSDSIGQRDYSYIRQSEPWLSSANAAGLKHLPVNNISTGDVHAGISNGKFVNYYQSSGSYTWGAQVESFYRLNTAIVFYGKVSYDNFTGKRMGGSAFINPARTPFDIVEDADSTRSKKNLESYNLTGAVSVDVYKGLTLGAKLDYKAANYAKFKDLRHENKLLDMSLTAGLSYRLGHVVELGANYYYRRSTEGIVFEIDGTLDKTYLALVNYGAFFGKMEKLSGGDITGDGYIRDQEKPLFDEYNGASLQADFRLGAGFALFNEFSYKARSGYYGRKTPNKVVYSAHSSDIFGYRGELSLSRGHNRHALAVEVESEKLENNENIYKHESLPGGATTVTYYGTLEAGKKEWSKVRLDYTGNLGINDFNPVWVLNSGLEYNSRKQTAYMYPYYRTQSINYSTAHIYAKRNWAAGNNMYDLSLAFAYSWGGGKDKEDGLFIQPDESSTPPQTNNTQLEREYEYLTANQLKSSIGFRYSHLLNTGTRMYAGFRYNFIKASGIEFVEGNTRHEAVIAIGCVF
jgi:hypothetical protein